MTQATQVWVSYVSAELQFYHAVEFESGLTVRQAIDRSGLLQQVTFEQPMHVGIFSVQIADLDHVLEAGDRVEVYRALQANPKDIRRKRALANPVGRYCRGNRFKHLK
jgi:putative ubiquitin-RnfH superfamily antitoxin RatB of RatAB toxin-antitoxin module